MTSARGRAKYWLYNSAPGFRGRYPYFGTVVHFPKDAVLLHAVCDQGIFEAPIVQRMVSFATPGTTVFDVGANLGLMSVPVLAQRRDCRVVSFEPSPSSLPFLERTRAASAHADRWTIVGAAVAAQAGELDFTLGSPRDALYEGFRGSDRIAGARTIRVPVTTLDDTWRTLGKPAVSVIKIDVEGAEAGVLAGGAELFQGTRPATLIEWNESYLRRYDTRFEDLLTFAARYRYRVFTIPAGIPVDDAPTLRAQGLDCDNFLLLPS